MQFYYFRNFNAWCHLLKASLGIGILAMPSAFNDSGYLVGMWGTIFIGILCTYSIHLLVSIYVPINHVPTELSLSLTKSNDYIIFLIYLDRCVS